MCSPIKLTRPGAQAPIKSTSCSVLYTSWKLFTVLVSNSSNVESLAAIYAGLFENVLFEFSWLYPNKNNVFKVAKIERFEKSHLYIFLQISFTAQNAHGVLIFQYVQT